MINSINEFRFLDIQRKEDSFNENVKKTCLNIDK